MSMMLFTESEMAQLTAHLRKETAERERAEQENQAISNLMEQYAEMSYLYQVEELTPPAEQQIESLRLVSFAEEMERSQQEEREIPRTGRDTAHTGTVGSAAEGVSPVLPTEGVGDDADERDSSGASPAGAGGDGAAVSDDVPAGGSTADPGGENLRGLEEVQRSGMIEAQLREILTAELAY